MAREDGAAGADGSGRLPESPFPMWIFHTESGEILVANEPAAKAYGCTLAELLACSVGEVSQSWGPGAEFIETLRRPPPWTATLAQRRKDGATFEVDVAMIEMGNAGPTAVMVIACPVLHGGRTEGHHAYAGGGDASGGRDADGAGERERQLLRAGAKVNAKAP